MIRAAIVALSLAALAACATSSPRPIQPGKKPAAKAAPKPAAKAAGGLPRPTPVRAAETSSVSASDIPRPVPIPSASPAFARAPAAGTSKLIWPVDGVVISTFGMREGARHDGIDIGAPAGTPIWAAAAGTVLYVGEQPGYGLVVILTHEDGWVTIYAHNSENRVREDDAVKQGDPIARVGQSGSQSTPALHFELRIDRKPVNPLSHLPE